MLFYPCSMSTMLTEITKRDGSVVPFDPGKIRAAIVSCLTEGCGWSEASSGAVADQITSRTLEYLDDWGDTSPSVEDVQNVVESCLMEAGYHQPARRYILYREERRKERERPRIFERRVAFKPFEYPEIVKYKDAINHSYWLVSEWNFIADIQDFNTRLTPVEQNAIKNTLLAISQIEVSVKKFWAKLGDRFPKAEFEQVGICFGESEIRHADAYSHLLQVLGLNSDFELLLQNPVIQGRVDYLTKYLRGAADNSNESYTLTLTLFSIFIENVSLFSQFAIIKAFNKHRNILKDIDNVVQATQKEETIHALFGAHVISQIKAEYPEWFNEEFYAKIYRACRKAYAAEEKIIDWIFEAGELEFLSKETLKAFIQARFNESLALIGGEPVFEVDPAALEPLAWFEEELHAPVATDFFHKKPVTYSKMMQPTTAEDLF